MKPFNKEQEGKNWINTFRLTWTHHYNFPGIYKKQKKHANYNLYLCTLLLSKIFVQRTFYFLYIIDIKQNFLFALDCRFKTSFIRKNCLISKNESFSALFSAYIQIPVTRIIKNIVSQWNVYKYIVSKF